MLKNLALVTVVIFAAGCGFQFRSYVMTKDRVGLDRGNGNGGCIMGTCPPPAPPKETTRKVYVLEITRPVPESEVRKIEENAENAIVGSEAPPNSNIPPAEPSAPAQPQDAQPAAPSVPVVGELPGTAPAAQPEQAAQPAAAGQAQTYTVQKDDTLQKISKKIYGSYGKWYKIYEANKEKIKNPNILQPGVVLTIPPLK